ncbi:MAG TPA: hypothetical protein VEY92_00290 [Pseudoxanthomonas sp.]|nr:hypothetical protein [Pseudoxanthomonas sp.]
MEIAALNFDLCAMTKPKNRQDVILLAREIIDQLTFIDECIDAAIVRCEAVKRAEAFA